MAPDNNTIKNIQRMSKTSG